jgi:nicotinamidase-related amidase
MRCIHGVEVLTTVEELANPVQSAVLVIDMQNEIVYGSKAYDETKLDKDSLIAKSIPRIQSILSAARERHIPVIYAEILHFDAKGKFLSDGPNLFCHRNKDSDRFTLKEGERGSQTIQALAPQPNDLIIRKDRASAFSSTALDPYLKARQVRSVIITGTSTRGCVLMTAVDAEMHGYYPVVLSDCVSTGSARWQELALTWMESEMAVLTSRDVLSAWAAFDDPS